MKNLFLILTILMLVSSCATSLKQQTDSALPKAGATGSAFLSKSAVFALIKANSSGGSQIKSESFSENKKEKVKTVPKYMTALQVKAALVSFKAQTKSLEAWSFTEEDKERLSHLRPIDELIPPEIRTFKSLKKLSTKADPLYQPKAEGVDLRFRDSAVKSQDDGRCTAFAGASAIENAINSKNIIPNLQISAWDIWFKYGVYSCSSFISALSKPINKVCNEVDYPQYGTRSKNCEINKYAYISDYSYLGSDTDEIIRALNEKHVVYFGMSTPNDVVRCKAVINPKNGFANGAHALLVNGYLPSVADKEPVLIVKNSWGSSCSDSGYFYLPISMLKNPNSNSAYWEIKEISITTTPTLPHVEPSCVKWKTIWYKPWMKECVKWN